MLYFGCAKVFLVTRWNCWLPFRRQGRCRNWVGCDNIHEHHFGSNEFSGSTSGRSGSKRLFCWGHLFRGTQRSRSILWLFYTDICTARDSKSPPPKLSERATGSSDSEKGQDLILKRTGHHLTTEKRRASKDHLVKCAANHQIKQINNENCIQNKYETIKWQHKMKSDTKIKKILNNY